jgi:hypothetical protein
MASFSLLVEGLVFFSWWGGGGGFPFQEKKKKKNQPEKYDFQTDKGFLSKKLH